MGAKVMRAEIRQTRVRADASEQGLRLVNYGVLSVEPVSNWGSGPAGLRAIQGAFVEKLGLFEETAVSYSLLHSVVRKRPR